MISQEGNLSILIAAYNEESNIGKTIAETRNAFSCAEIVVVDDDSKDQTFSEAKKFENNFVKVVSIFHCGKGGAIRRAIAEASRDIMVQVDADLQFPLEGILTLIRPILEGKADIVFGSRYLDPSGIEKKSVSFSKRMSSYIVGIIISIICGQRYTDVFGGLKAWKADVIKDINIQENSFAYEAEIAIKAKRYGYTVIEVPTAYKRRVGGKSKIRFLYHIFEIPWRIMHIAACSRKK